MYGGSGYILLQLAGALLGAIILAAIADLHGLEILLVLTALWIARRWPRYGHTWFSRMEAAGVRLARHRVYAPLAVAASALAFRLALLPLLPVPHPGIPDEFSHLLLADTFAHGRLTNPVHPVWQSFESIHVLQQPTYNSMYFPGPALLLLIGQLLTGIPWIGLLLGTSALCGLICWALQAYVPPRWALLGGFLAVLKIGIASYWMNSYWGGTFGALGGTLLLGTIPRLQRRPTIALSLVAALGIAMLANSRPYEGLWLCLPVGLRLAVWLFEKTRRVSLPAKLFKVALPMALVLAATGVSMGVYFKAVTGDPLRFPYAINEQRMGWPMTLPWMDLRAVDHHRPEFAAYYLYELTDRLSFTSLDLYLSGIALRLQQDWRFYVGPALTLALLFLARIYRSRRLRFLLYAGSVALFGVYMEPHFPHYMGPITLFVIAIEVQGIRYLRRLAPPRRAAGIWLSRAIPVILLATLAARVALPAFHVPFQEWAGYTSWCCTATTKVDQQAIDRMLPPGTRHLVLVSYPGQHQYLDQWVYNGADVDSARVVWARSLDPETNRRLRDYYPDRHFWTFCPDRKPWKLVPLP